MALITSNSATRKIETTDVIVESIIPLQDSKCPVNKTTGEIIPKSLLRLSDGAVLGVLTNQLKNVPVAIPAGGMSCKLSFENVEYTPTAGPNAGKKQTVSNVINAEFASTLRYVVEHAKSVSTAGMF